MDGRRARRTEQLKRDGFPFEGGTVTLPNGTSFVPKRDSVEHWVIEHPSRWAALGSTYVILYQLEGDRFVQVTYVDEECAKNRLSARTMSKDESLTWLLEQHCPLPDLLQSKVRFAAGFPGLATVLRKKSIVQKIRKISALFEPERADDVAEFRDLMADCYGITAERASALTSEQVEQALDSYLEFEVEIGDTTSEAPVVDEYEWARQVDLVRATNQVLGDVVLAPWAVSRACTEGQIDTNGKRGPASRVSVLSFLAWITKHQELEKREATQIRNAIMGEIMSRNSERNNPD